MTPLPKNYRDVGASLSCLGFYSLKPGLILRSSSWDTQPKIRWKDIGRPKVILNLRAHSETNSYDQLALETNLDREGTAEGAEEMVTPPQIWQLSADKNLEKYDLSLNGSMEWLVSILQKLLEDKGVPSSPNEDDNIPSLTSSDQSAIERHLSTLSPSVLKSESVGIDEQSATQSTFQIALGYVLLRRISREHAPLLIHCRFGRDRTGIVIAFLLKLLIPSIPDKYILKEFLLSDLTCSETTREDMIENGNMLENLTLKNLPLLFEYIEMRRKIIFEGENYKETRKEISRVMTRLDSASQITLSLPVDFFVHDKHLRSEGRRHFKNAQQHLSSIGTYINVDEKHHALWSAFAFHFSLYTWMVLVCDKNEITTIKQYSSSIHTVSNQLYQFHVLAVSIQLAWILIQEEISLIYPLPQSMCSERALENIHKNLHNNVCELEAKIRNTKESPPSILQRVQRLKEKITND